MPPKKQPTTKEILESAPVTLRQIEERSKELGTPIPYDTLRSWTRDVDGRGVVGGPRPETLAALADVLDSLGTDAKRAAAQARKLAAARRRSSGSAS